MATDRPPVLYWDASAVVSLLEDHPKRRDVSARLRYERTHLLSSLTLAEALATVTRRTREGRLTPAAAREMRSRLDGDPWRPVTIHPDRDVIGRLAREHRLRGADLWHLATVATLAQSIPELRLLTYDERLRSAAEAMGLAA